MVVQQEMTKIGLAFGAVAMFAVACTAQPNVAAPSTTLAPTRSAVGTQQPFRLLIHCGLSHPLTFDNRFWLPVDRLLRRTHNPPDGFGGDENYDDGIIRVIDEDTLVYESSEGIEVEYEPTRRRPRGCE